MSYSLVSAFPHMLPASQVHCTHQHLVQDIPFSGTWMVNSLRYGGIMTIVVS